MICMICNSKGEITLYAHRKCFKNTIWAKLVKPRKIGGETCYFCGEWVEVCFNCGKEMKFFKCTYCGSREYTFKYKGRKFSEGVEINVCRRCFKNAPFLAVL